MSLTSGFLGKSLIMGALLSPCLASASDEPLRGNDLGDGGDETREVIRAARLFTNDLLKDLQPRRINADKFPQEELNIYKNRFEALSKFNNNAPYVAAKEPVDCAKASEDKKSIEWSYDQCSGIIETAFDALPIILRESLNAILEDNEVGLSESVANELVKVWAKEFSEAASAAKKFTRARPTITGTWFIMNGKKREFLTVSPEGKFDAFIHIAQTTVRFSKPLTLNTERTAFQAETELKLVRPKNPNPNVVAESYCIYPVQVVVEREPLANGGQLRLEVSSTGESKSPGCKKISVQPFTLKYQLNK